VGSGSIKPRSRDVCVTSDFNQGEKQMTLMTGAQYVQSLRERRPLRLFVHGERIENPLDHPLIRPSINSVALTYDTAHEAPHKDLMTARSALTGKRINRFCHLHQSPDDLMSKVKMQRLLGQKCGTCFQRCVGMDALNAIFATTYEVDEKYGTHYHERMIAYLKVVEEEDWIIDGAMTDVKGDRAKRPAEQSDPDMYVRVVERTADGVVIRGAKAHQTGAINSHEHLIMPTVAMRPQEKDYAICCSIPVDAEGITYIYGRQSCDLRTLDESAAGDVDTGNPCYGGQEVLVIFEDVFVPNERIYLDGEVDFTGMLVERFAGYHRQSYGGCKTGVGDVAIGAAALVAEYNGTDKTSHIKDKIVEMVHLNETMWACGLACSADGQPTPAGNYLINTLLANVCKQNVTRFPYEIARLLQDIAGGLFVTMPSARDFYNPETKGYIEKYLKTRDDVAVLDRMKIMRLIENLTMGRAAVGYLAESMHGAGSPQAQRIMMSRLANVDAKKRLAAKLARIGADSASARVAYQPLGIHEPELRQ
jgi:4-hydroxybutyryl-CoA dehydratase/vinylacetyl-CoA-Delta-isomerase